MMIDKRIDIRLSLPSKGRLSENAVDFLSACGLDIDKPNPRQYEARIPALPQVTVLFQRPSDIVVSVRDGSVDFGITGMDVTVENGGVDGEILVLHDALGFGKCHLAIAVPETWKDIQTVADLSGYAGTLGRPLRLATKFPNVTQEFLRHNQVAPLSLIHAEGTLEVAPAIGYADCIADLVSSGQTLRDNRLRPLSDGIILRSQAALIANRAALRARPEVLDVARILLEFTEAYLRAREYVMVVANMRGESPQAITEKMFRQQVLGGLQGPTISPVIVKNSGDLQWYAVQIAVRRAQLFQAVTELRAIGGSGVVVTPVTYIFEEEPARYMAMMQAVNADNS
ncbi:MAG: ATP phosphoribosyltransferase [Anaerolineae bacterium]|nr:ATP phosphoribosyltransferase [Anaerolineae bacterium]